MSNIREEVLRANDEYAKTFGDRSKLALPPARQFAILTCMDARIDPAKVAGLREGDAHVIRNAGGRASDDAIRSLVISYKLLGTREWFVIHHSNCGMELFNDQIIRGLLSSSLETSSYDGKTWKDPGRGKGSEHGEFIDWLTIQNQAKSVVIDVERIKTHALVPKSIPVYGYVYQVETGRLVEIPEATEIGRAA
jgi:carbonic anhydrase